MTFVCRVFRWQRGYDIRDALSNSAHFSDVVDSTQKYYSRGIAFVSLDGENICYVMVYENSGRVATKIDRLTFKRPMLIDPPLALSDIEDFLPSRLKKHFRNQTSIGTHILSQAVLKSLRDFLLKTSPDLAQNIDRLEREMLRTHYGGSGSGAGIVAHEKDAISLALRISGFGDDDIPDWSQKNESAPFLQGYQNVVIREDPMVIHDSQVFGDWNKIGQYVVGAAEFKKKGHKLTILNVNRHKVEETLGVDLIIYHHTYKSYVLIQYKRMTREGDSLCYRPLDSSYLSEMERMDEFLVNARQSKELTTSDYRLNDGFFYFKLCPAEIKEPMSTKMIPGMYLPLSYWKLLLASDETLGQKGGRIISYNNVRRHINNTLFVDLVQSGWLGSQVENTTTITEQIRRSIEAKRSVILANYVPDKEHDSTSLSMSAGGNGVEDVAWERER